MDETKRQDLPAGLWVVATPIGNLGDLTERARGALASADFVLCEDTRRTSQLLAALSIEGKSLERLDAHATPAKIEAVTRRLESGESAALVTDAGTPSISDPGSQLVRKCREAGVRVTAVPGPSAVASLLSVCGFDETAFAFRGFFPRKAGDGKKELELAASSKLARVCVWFESPQRVGDTLALVAVAAPGAEVVAAKELTKFHESLFSGSASEVSESVRGEIAREGAKGEWCFAVRFEPLSEERSESSDWVKALQCLLNARVSASEAARQVSQHFGVSRNSAYAMAIAKKDG